jgi:hypothetical protein
VTEHARNRVAWYADWQVFLVGVAVLAVMWVVESLRKGEVMWPWPAVPVVVWLLAVLTTRLFRRAGYSR